MCKGSLLFLICTASISSIMTLPFHPAAIEVAVHDVSERENNLYLVILNGLGDSHRNIKISEQENNYYEVPMKLLYKIRRNLRPHVEIGPGVFKSEIVQYPSDILNKRLQYLMKLKEKLEERI